jgi:hypothetical protein
MADINIYELTSIKSTENIYEILEHLTTANKGKTIIVIAPTVSNAPQENMSLAQGYCNKEAYVKSLIRKLGVPCYHRCYHILVDALLWSIEDNEMVEKITSLLYPALATWYGSTAGVIEKSIRTAIKVMWQLEDQQEMIKLIGYSKLDTDKQPTNKAFITAVMDDIISKAEFMNW